MRRWAWIAGILLTTACASAPAPKPRATPLEILRARPWVYGTGAIYGTVRDVASGEPIARALVYILTPGTNTSFDAYTDDDGVYLVTDVPAGYYEVYFWYDWVDLRRVVTVSSGKATPINVLADDSRPPGAEVITLD